MNLAVLPIVIPLFTALFALFWGRPSRGRRWFIAVSALAQIGIASVLVWKNWHGEALVLGVGNWSYRVGIMLVVDLLAAVMAALCTVVSLAAILYTFAECRISEEHPLRLPLMQLLVLGINLSFFTGDLFNLFVAFEVMLIASYALLTLEADNWSVKQAFPYLAINLAGGTLFLCAAGLAYALFGTLNFADISVRVADMEGDARILAVALLLMVVFCTKAGLFPLFYWLPNSYTTLPFPLAALFAGLLTKVGVYVLLRLFCTILPHDLPLAHDLLVWLAGGTMVLAILGAVARNYVRGILAFNLLSHIGFMALAIGLFTPRSLAAAIYYIMHHIVVMASLFLITGVVTMLNRSDHLPRMGHLWKRTPWVGALFMLQAMSLAGVPPLSGFWGKYLIVEAGLGERAYAMVGAVIIASILTMLSMIKIWNGAFWSAPVDVTVDTSGDVWRKLAWVAAGLLAISLVLGVGAEWFMQLSLEAAEQLLDKSGYVGAVFQAAGKGGF